MNISRYVRTARDFEGLLRAHGPARVRRSLKQIARAGILASAVALNGCGTEPEPGSTTREPAPGPVERTNADRPVEPPDPPTAQVFRLMALPGMSEVDCASIPNADLSDHVAVDALAVYQGNERIMSRGEPCATARDRQACAAALADFPFDVPEGDPEPFLWITNEHGATLFAPARDRETGRLRELLLPIDTIPRALLWTVMTGEGAGCGSLFRERDGAVEAVVQRHTDCGQHGEQRLIRVAPDGEIATLDREPFVNDGPCDGRRPEGLRGAPIARDLGSHLARMAYHEAASVQAFDELAGQLAAWGAPGALVAACRSAARDEERHAEQATACAREHGASVPGVAPRRRRSVSLFSFALENAREGCVREAYGSIVGEHQAHAALDPSVRSLMAAVAPDETEHAVLSYRLAGWMDERLSPDERALVRGEETRAARALEIDARTGRRPRYAALLGLPSRAIGAQMACRLRQDLLAA